MTRTHEGNNNKGGRGFVTHDFEKLKRRGIRLGKGGGGGGGGGVGRCQARPD